MAEWAQSVRAFLLEFVRHEHLTLGRRLSRIATLAVPPTTSLHSRDEHAGSNMPRGKKKNGNESTATVGFEAQLWAAADALVNPQLPKLVSGGLRPGRVERFVEVAT